MTIATTMGVQSIGLVLVALPITHHTILSGVAALFLAVGVWWMKKQTKKSVPAEKGVVHDTDLSVLPCIRNRRSVFPRAHQRNAPPLDPAVIQSLLDAAVWGPFHGKCYMGCQHPAKYVVLGKKSMVEMQQMTLAYCDEHWQTMGWASGTRGTQEQYQAWRKMTEEEITGRWAPCDYMIAIVMQRQTGPKRLPEWEEAAAVAAATQNMHLQSTKFSQLACYWSSWHDAARDSQEMKDFLKMGPEDRCLGFLIVAQVTLEASKDRRRRDSSLLAVEWRE